MRFIIYGAGGIGGTIGGRLFQAGHDVVLIARGAHLQAIRDRGLLLRTPEGDYQLPIPAAGHPRDVEFADGDVVFLTMKTQDTEPALRDLELAAGTAIPVICAQNGVENERLAVRRFANVYAMLVALPATFLEPGEVIASATPFSGALHACRYPSGTDQTLVDVCAALRGAHFLSDAEPLAMQLKYRKLLHNLGNALEIVTHQAAWGAGGALGELAGKLREEAVRCYEAAGIVATPADEYVARVQRHYKSAPVGGTPRSGSSTWQSVLRGHTTVEVDYLNGEIVLLGALHRIPTPHNSIVRRLAVAAARAGGDGVPLSVEALVGLIESEAAPRA